LNFKKIRRSKRGQDGGGSVAAIIALVVVVVFTFAFVLVNSWGQTLIDEFQTEFTSANGYSNESIAVITNADNTYSGVVDSIGMFIVVGLWILVFGLAYNSGQSPILGFLAVIIVMIVGLVGMILGNSWDEYVADPDMSHLPTDYPMMNFVLSNYLPWVLVIGFTMILGFFLGARNT
jgi:uncharacterized membrane protein YidH (DUF202 family)